MIDSRCIKYVKGALISLIENLYAFIRFGLVYDEIKANTMLMIAK